MERLSAFVISACDETVTNSKKSKFSFDICGKPVVKWVVDALKELGVKDVSIILDGYNKDILKDHDVQFSVGWPRNFLEESRDHILMISGDMPLIEPDTLYELFASHLNSRHAATTAIGKSGNAGIYFFKKKYLKDNLRTKEPFTPEKQVLEAIRRIFDKGIKVGTIELENKKEFLRIDDKVDLNTAETTARKRIAAAHMKKGVTIKCPEMTFIDFDVQIGADTEILPGTMLSGKTIIGEGCIIGPDSEILNSIIKKDVRVNRSEILESHVDCGSNIGPFSFLRTGSMVGRNVRVGNFVEIKNSTIGEGTQIAHLSYIGDATVGKEVNIGAGVVTVNFDGGKKSRTEISDNAFIGCNSNLIAPVKIGEKAYVAAGSTITDGVPANALAIARERQIIKENWVKDTNILKGDCK